MIKTIMLCACSSAIATATANAVLINITIDAAGNPLNGSGTANSTQYIPSNNNPTNNLTFLDREISLWNAAFDPDLPAAVGPVALDDGSIGDVNSYNVLGGYAYVVFHFGNGRAGGSPGGWWQAWYLGGSGGSILVPTVGGQRVGGFSSARYYNPNFPPPVQVPDGGMTVVLLGMGAIALGIVSRKTVQA